MIEQPAAKWFASLSVQNKTIVLSRLVFGFSLIIRDITTSPSDASTIRRLQGVGEMTHVIMSYLVALNSANDKRFADEELIELLFEMGDPYGLHDAFTQAWRHASSMALPSEH